DNWDEEGNFYNNDVDRFYGVINDDQDLILFQYINFDPLTKKPEDFKQANAVYNFNVDKLL
ncbi:MAG: hypothetical protein GX879_05425, partial [Bacteroidales bacterium]|nr:hypothetical protein [Bacteroidales bacterium]